MDKVNKMFKGMYTFMGILGVLMAGLALLAGYRNAIFTDNIYGPMIIILASLSLITVLSALFNRSKEYEKIHKVKLTAIRGHIALFFGFSSYIIIMAYDNGTELATTLMLLGVFAAYIAVMLVMFFWLIKRIEKKAQESERVK